MLRNVVLIVALVGINLLLLNWYRNEAHKLDTDGSGTVSNAEISGQSSGIIPGLDAAESGAVRTLCDKNNDGKLSVEEIEKCFQHVAAQAAVGAAAEASADKNAKIPEATEAQIEAKSIYDRGVRALTKLKQYNYRGLFERITTTMRKHKVASFIVVIVLLVPLHFAGALPRMDGFLDSVESTFSKIFQFSGADSRKDFISYIIFITTFIVVPAGYVFADIYDVTHFHMKDEDKSKWQKLTNRFHAGEITLFCALVFTACVRRVRSTGLSVLLLVPYIVSVVALDVTDLVPTVTKASFPEFLQPIAGPLVSINLLAHVVMTYAVPAITLFILTVLPEEDDGTRAALANKDVVKAAAEMLKSRAGHQYYLRSCPAVVPSSVSNLIRVLSNGTAQIDAIIPAIVTAFIPVTGYFLQARIAKAVIISTVIVLIWFDFYERQLKGENLQSFKAFFDLNPATPLEDAPRVIIHSMLHPEKEDKAFHHSLFNHLLSHIMVCLFQFFDVLTYKSPSHSA